MTSLRYRPDDILQGHQECRMALVFGPGHVGGAETVWVECASHRLIFGGTCEARKAIVWISEVDLNQPENPVH